jgi:hypothetical protein
MKTCDLDSRGTSFSVGARHRHQSRQLGSLDDTCFSLVSTADRILIFRSGVTYSGKPAFWHAKLSIAVLTIRNFLSGYKFLVTPCNCCYHRDAAWKPFEKLPLSLLTDYFLEPFQ